MGLTPGCSLLYDMITDPLSPLDRGDRARMINVLILNYLADDKRSPIRLWRALFPIVDEFYRMRYVTDTTLTVLRYDTLMAATGKDLIRFLNDQKHVPIFKSMEIRASEAKKIIAKALTIENEQVFRRYGEFTINAFHPDETITYRSREFKRLPIPKLNRMLFYKSGIKESRVRWPIDLLPPSTESAEKITIPAVRGIVIKDNSCYMDSLFMFMLMTESAYWRNAVLYSNISERDYENVAGICRKDSKIKTVKEVAALAEKIQWGLISLYANIKEGKVDVCSNIRVEIAKCLTNIRVRSQSKNETSRSTNGVSHSKNERWVTFTASELYSTLTDLFPRLKLEYNAFTLKGDDILRRSALFQLSDLMYSYAGVTILQEYNFPILVFQNGGIPPFRRLNSDEDERFEGVTYKKTGKLGEYILGDRYRLDGVLTLQGTVPGRSSGVHYIAYIRRGASSSSPRITASEEVASEDASLKGEWYAYNDIQPRFEKIDRLPDRGVWLEEGGEKPEMFFYTRVV